MTVKGRATHPEPIVGARVREVDDQLERLVVERLECQKHVVDQQITVHIQHPNSPITQTLCNSPAEHSWRPLFNAAKFGWRPLLECRAVTKPRCETR